MIQSYEYDQYYKCSKRSIYRWRNRIVLYVRTGNKCAYKLTGQHQFLFILYRIFYPKTTADEVRRFLFENSGNPIMFSRMDIYRAEID